MRFKIARYFNPFLLTKNLRRGNDKYQFMDKSAIPTFHFQQSLPKIPIPELQQTCQRFLSALKPILTSEEWKDAEKVTKEFEIGEGKALDRRLREVFKTSSNYGSDVQVETFLKERAPIAIYYNPSTHYNVSVPKLKTQLLRSTSLTISLARFIKSLRSNLLQPLIFHSNPTHNNSAVFRTVVKYLPGSWVTYGANLFGAQPMDMSQYHKMFSSCRIPIPIKDEFRVEPTARHILVIRKGHFFKFDLFDSKNDIYPPENILACFRYILALNLEMDKSSPGILTTMNRDKWALLRKYLISLSPKNVNFFEEVETAIFTLCLDDVDVTNNESEFARCIFIGDAHNRWFDKSFQVIISADGSAGVNFEHSWGDGMAVLHCFQRVYEDCKKAFVSSEDVPSEISPENCVTVLELVRDSSVLQAIEEAASEFKRLSDSLQVCAIVKNGFGKVNCKGAKISPDSVVQLAYQTAYYKLYKEFAVTYESCSTGSFLHGRTEILRPCTEATRDFIVAFSAENPPSDSFLLYMMRKCNTVHKELAREAACGHGFDQHLSALRFVAQKEGISIKLFEHPAFLKMNRNTLASSTVGTAVLRHGAFVPMEENGIGIGYCVGKDSVGIGVTSYVGHKDADAFVKKFVETIEQFTKILQVENSRL